MVTWRSAWAIPLALLALLVGTGTVSADGSTMESGTWQKHQYSFVSMGFTSTYSCDGLAGKLKRLLLVAGARSDVKVGGACPRGFGRVDKLAQADLTFYTLLPNEDHKPADGPRVDGVWRAVVFARHSPRELALGDCELVEQFRSQLLPMFTTRNAVNQTTCIPYQDSGSVINLRFESFAAAPAKAAASRSVN